MSDELFKRVLEGNCPICGKPLKSEETTVVHYKEGKLEVHKKHIKSEEK